LQPKVLSSLLHDVYTMQSSQQLVATANVTASVMRQQFYPLSRKLKRV